MAAFSIFTRDGEPAEDSLLDPQEPAVLSYRRESPRMTEPPLDQPKSDVNLEHGLSGQIVLRLPDLSNSRPNTLRWLLGPYLFWIAIGLGALLAIALIWTGKKSAPRPVDEAPAWTSQGPRQRSAPVEIKHGTPEQTPPEIRAARRVGPPWDGSSPPVMPGVAVPVGTIITGAPE